MPCSKGTNPKELDSCNIYLTASSIPETRNQGHPFGIFRPWFRVRNHFQSAVWLKPPFQEPQVSGRNRFQDLGRVSVPNPLSENGFGPKPVSQKGGGFRFRNRFQKTVSGRNRFHSFRVHFDLFRWKTAFRFRF